MGNTKPTIFIGSSVEGLELAYAIQENLDYDADCTVWDQDIFELSTTTIESLMMTIKKHSFAIFVFTPDDTIISRGKNYNAIRDNIIFELGLFIGNKGRDKVFFVMPRDSNLKLPTDLLGITPGKYNNKRSDNNLKAAIGPFCNQVRKTLEKTVNIEINISPTQALEATNIIRFNEEFTKENYYSRWNIKEGNKSEFTLEKDYSNRKYLKIDSNKKFIIDYQCTTSDSLSNKILFLLQEDSKSALYVGIDIFNSKEEKYIFLQIDYSKTYKKPNKVTGTNFPEWKIYLKVKKIDKLWMEIFLDIEKHLKTIEELTEFNLKGVKTLRLRNLNSLSISEIKFYK